jgi:hypothetical protein
MPLLHSRIVPYPNSCQYSRRHPSSTAYAKRMVSILTSLLFGPTTFVQHQSRVPPSYECLLHSRITPYPNSCQHSRRHPSSIDGAKPMVSIFASLKITPLLSPASGRQQLLKSIFVSICGENSCVFRTLPGCRVTRGLYDSDLR